MPEIRISCILPAKENFQSCVRAIKCFQAQTYADRELIVVDAGVPGLAAHVQGLADPSIKYVTSHAAPILDRYRTGIASSTGGLIAAWSEFCYSDPLRLTFQHEILKGEKTDVAIISSITLAVPDNKKFGYSRQGLWTSTLLAPPNLFLNFIQYDFLEDPNETLKTYENGMSISLFTAPDLFIATLPGYDEAYIARRFSGAFEKLTLPDLVRIVEKLTHTDYAHSPRSGYDSVFHAYQLLKLDVEKADKYFAAFLEAPVANEWVGYDVICEYASSLQHREKSEGFMEAAMKLLQSDPSRAEGYNLLGIHYYRKEPLKAIPLFVAASSATKPKVPYNIYQGHYSWVPFDYLTACYTSLGNYKKAIEMNIKGQTSAEQKDRMKQRLRELVDML